jgi:uncharacterized protein YbaR (Trm112 family)
VLQRVALYFEVFVDLTMSMSLLDILACPICKADVIQFESSSLRCTGCGRVFPIHDGIPNMMPEDNSLESKSID